MSAASIDSHCRRKICRGRPLRATRDSFVDGFRLIIPIIDPRGDATVWIGNAKSEAEWVHIVKRMHNRDRGKFDEGEPLTEPISHQQKYANVEQ